MKVTLRRELEMQGVGAEIRGWEIVIQGECLIHCWRCLYSLLSNILKCSREYCLYLGIYSLDWFGDSFSSFSTSFATFHLEACGPSYLMSSNVSVLVLSNVVEVSWTVTTNEGRKKGKGLFQDKKKIAIIRIFLFNASLMGDGKITSTPTVPRLLSAVKLH